MRVVIACDHVGLPLKETVIDSVRQAGHEIIDVGTFTPERVDFPDFAEKGGQLIQSGQADRGIFICGSGIGVCITANKMKGIYAGLCHDTYSAHQGVEHDNMNVLCLGGRIIGVEPTREIVTAFINAKFIADESRFQKRVDKIKEIEKKG